jgi:hypothetical protein
MVQMIQSGAQSLVSKIKKWGLVRLTAQYLYLPGPIALAAIGLPPKPAETPGRTYEGKPFRRTSTVVALAPAAVTATPTHLLLVAVDVMSRAVASQ